MCDLTGVFQAGFGSLFGAGLAFFLNVLYDKKQTKGKNIAALKKADYIIRKMHSFNNDLKQHIAKSDKKTGGYFEDWEKIDIFNIHSLLPEIKLNSLLFLVAYKKEGEQALNDIFSVNLVYQDLIQTLKERNKMYSTYSHKKAKHSPASQDQLLILIGKNKALYGYLKSYTTRLIEENEKFTEDCKKAEKIIAGFLEGEMK